MGKLLSLLVLLGLGYFGVYTYYGMAVEKVLDEQLDESGMTAVEVDNLDYSWLAPISQSAEVSANVRYRGASVSLELAVEGHPLFGDELQVSLGSLKGLSLGIDFGQ